MVIWLRRNVIWLRRNADRITLVVGVALVLAALLRTFGTDVAMITAGLLLIAGSLRRTPL